MRTLDDIIPPSRRTPAEGAEPAVPNTPQRPLQVRAPRGRFPWTTAIVALIIIAAAIATLIYFSEAEVRITPNEASVGAAGSYTAVVSGTLPFEIVQTTKTATQTVAASGSKTVSSQASGVVTVSNTQAKSQTLIANTRFETPTGLVFRIHSAVTIPANGTKQATVYADQPGSDYDIGPASFTVPGLANTPQFNEVTAKSSGSMTGGASGTIPVVAPAIAEASENSLADSMGPDLANAIAAQVPAGYVLLAGAATTTFAANTPIAASSTGMAQLSETGTISAVVFPNAALASAIATANESGYDGEPVSIQNPNALTAAGGLPSASDQSFTFSLSGTANLLSTIDSDQISAAVAGKSREAAQVALTNFPAIKTAVLILRPFWDSAFPADPSRIKVVVESAN